MMTETVEQNQSLVINFIIGGVTAVIKKTAFAPFERVKLLLQCQNEIVQLGRLPKPYKGVFDCISRTYKSEGLSSFWRGNIAGCITFFTSQALNFALKDKTNAIFQANANDGELHVVKLFRNIASGASAGAVTLSVVYSMDYTRTRLANDVKNSKQGNDRQFKGIIDVYKQTFRIDGIVGLYRGFLVSCVGIAVYRGFYFGLYDTLKPVLIGDKSNIIPSYAVGFGVTICAGLLSYPFDTVRRRMMMRSGEKKKYRGAIDCATQIMRNEGPLSFMKGASIQIIHGIFGAAALVGFGELKNWYQREHGEGS